MGVNPRATEAAPHSLPYSAASEWDCLALERDWAGQSSRNRECLGTEAVAGALDEHVDRQAVRGDSDGLGHNPVGSDGF